MANANDFWELKAEIATEKETLAKCKIAVKSFSGYARQYARQKQLVMSLEQDLESVVRDLMKSDTMTLDIRMAIKDVAKLPVANETELSAFWNTSTIEEKEEMLYKVGMRKSVVDAMNIVGNWATLREGVRDKLMRLIP